jgi:hypothetical protein
VVAALGRSAPIVDGAFEMYRDFDGGGGHFGDTSIASSSSDIARASIHASVDASSADRMVLVAINRSSAPITAGFRVGHTRRFGTARVFHLTAASASPTAGGTIAITLTNAFTATLPGHSVTTLELVP